VGTPDAAEFWRIIAKYKVKNMFTAPTALRAMRGQDPEGKLHKEHDLSSLQTMFLAGERSDTNTVDHYIKLLGVNCVDHWWQTESGSPMCGMQFDTHGTIPGSCGLPLPFFDMRVLRPPDETDPVCLCVFPSNRLLAGGIGPHASCTP
jgi:propionyl-CoA synthetase